MNDKSGQETVCKVLGWEWETTERLTGFPKPYWKGSFIRKGTPQTILL